MNEAYFIRNPNNLAEMKIKCRHGNPFRYIIEKVVEISEQEYKEFSFHLLIDNDFVRMYKDMMFLDANHIRHCILVTVAGAIDGILIQNEGIDRYAALWSYIDKKRSETRKEIT